MTILIYRWHAYNYADIIVTLHSMEHQVDIIEQEHELQKLCDPTMRGNVKKGGCGTAKSKAV